MRAEFTAGPRSAGSRAPGLPTSARPCPGVSLLGPHPAPQQVCRGLGVPETPGVEAGSAGGPGRERGSALAQGRLGAPHAPRRVRWAAAASRSTFNALIAKITARCRGGAQPDSGSN